MHNNIYILLKEDNGFQVTLEDFDIFKEQNLETFILSKDYSFSITEVERSNRLIKGQINFEILKYEAVSIAQKFDSGGIDYRFLKGLCVSLTYPMPYTRGMSDFDIIVKPEMIDKATRYLIDCGYTQDYDDPFSNEVSFNKVGAPNVDLHRDLFELCDQDFYADYEEIYELLWKEPSYIALNDYNIKVPSPLVHLKFLMLHFFKHFKGNGCGARFLLDVLFFSEFHLIDFNEIKSYFSKGMMNKFADLIKKMLFYYFDFGIIENMILSENDIENVQKAGDYLLYDGIYGKSSRDSEQTNRFILYKRAYHKSFFSLMQTSLFPNKESLDYRFVYAKKYTILLPIAWFHRFLGFIFGKRSIEKKMFFINKNDEVLVNKESFLKQLGFY